MADLPEQYLDDPSAWTPADHARRLTDPEYKPINPEWQAARDSALVKAGFAADPAPAKDLDELSDEEVAALTPADYLNRLHGERS